MSVYLVTWDLNREKPNYATARANFGARLDEYTNVKDPGLDSVRFVATTWSAQEIYTDLRKNLDDNDTIFVISFKDGSRQGWLSQNVWDWINSRL